MATITASAQQASTTRTTFHRETSVGITIKADDAIIWALLTNASDYPRWNSTVTSIQGNIALGEKIVMKSTLDAKRSFKLKVKEFEPAKKLVWGDGKGQRTYTLMRYGDGTVSFNMSERIGGEAMHIRAARGGGVMHRPLPVEGLGVGDAGNECGENGKSSAHVIHFVSRVVEDRVWAVLLGIAPVHHWCMGFVQHPVLSVEEYPLGHIGPVQRPIFEPLMRKVAAIVLSIQVLFSLWAPGGLAELLRIPSLCDHYEQHFAESGGTMSWAEFLVLHFADPEHEQKDSGRHGDLPFHNTAMACVLFVPPAGSHTAIRLEEAPPARTPVYASEIGEWPARSVFHPPKSIG